MWSIALSLTASQSQSVWGAHNRREADFNAIQLRSISSPGIPEEPYSTVAAGWLEGAEALPVVQLLDHDILKEAVGHEPAAQGFCLVRIQFVLVHAVLDECFHPGCPLRLQNSRHWHAAAWKEFPYACIRAQGGMDTQLQPGSKRLFSAKYSHFTSAIRCTTWAPHLLSSAGSGLQHCASVCNTACVSAALHRCGRLGTRPCHFSLPQLLLPSMCSMATIDTHTICQQYTVAIIFAEDCLRILVCRVAYLAAHAV